MHTVNIRISTRDMCAPLTVNKLLNTIRNSDAVLKLFWPRLVKGRGIKGEKRVSVKISSENLEYLRGLKKEIRKKYDIFVSYTRIIAVLMKIYQNPEERVVVSLNVHGYKALTPDFTDRLRGISRQIRDVLPDIFLIQEFRAGEGNKFLNILMAGLEKFYTPLFPLSYRKQDDYNNCICMILVGKNIQKIDPRRLKHESDGYRLRYNYVRLDDYVFLNTWAPQMYNADQERVGMAEAMWKEILDTAKTFRAQNFKFFLAGDLNASVGGTYEDKILKLNYLLTETKTPEDLAIPTGPINVLDYAFVNREAARSNNISTSILIPSIKEQELSDHEALFTTITAVRGRCV